MFASLGIESRLTSFSHRPFCAAAALPWRDARAGAKASDSTWFNTLIKFLLNLSVTDRTR
jgi:hypothetical protein